MARPTGPVRVASMRFAEDFRIGEVPGPAPVTLLRGIDRDSSDASTPGGPGRRGR